jgi:uncharacterized membrane protein
VASLFRFFCKLHLHFSNVDKSSQHVQLHQTAKQRIHASKWFLIDVCGLFPFTTLLASEHLLQNDANVAAAFYCSTFFVLSIVWNIAWHNASHHHHLIDENIPKSQIRRITRENIVAPTAGGISVIVAFISPIASITLILLLSVFYGITVTGGERFSRGSNTNL